MNIIVLDLKTKTDLEKAQALRDTAQKLTDNAADFPSAAPTPAQLIAAATAMETAITTNDAKQQVAQSSTAAKDASVAAGAALLTDAANWATLNVKDPVKLKKVYTLKKASVPTTSISQVTALALTFGDQPGWLNAMWNPPPENWKSFEVQVKLPGAPDFAHFKSVSASSALLKGLPAGQTVQIRVRAIGPKSLEGPWSDVATHLVP